MKKQLSITFLLIAALCTAQNKKPAFPEKAIVFDNGIYAHTQKEGNEISFKVYDAHGQLKWERALDWMPSKDMHTDDQGQVFHLSTYLEDTTVHRMFTYEGAEIPIDGAPQQVTISKNGKVFGAVTSTDEHDLYQIFQIDGNLIYEWTYPRGDDGVLILSPEGDFGMVIYSEYARNYVNMIDLRENAPMGFGFNYRLSLDQGAVTNAELIGPDEVLLHGTTLKYIKDKQVVWTKAAAPNNQYSNTMTSDEFIYADQSLGYDIFNKEGEHLYKFHPFKNAETLAKNTGFDKIFKSKAPNGVFTNKYGRDKDIKKFLYAQHDPKISGTNVHMGYHFNDFRAILDINTKQFRFVDGHPNDITYSPSGKWKLVLRGNNVVREAVKFKSSTIFLREKINKN